MEHPQSCLFSGEIGRQHSPLDQGAVCLTCHQTTTHELVRATDALEQTVDEHVDVFDHLAGAVRDQIANLRRIIAAREAT